MWDTAGEVRKNSWVTFSDGPFYREEQMLDDKL